MTIRRHGQPGATEEGQRRALAVPPFTAVQVVNLGAEPLDALDDGDGIPLDRPWAQKATGKEAA